MDSLAQVHHGIDNERITGLLNLLPVGGQREMVTKQCLAAPQRVTGRARTPVH